MTEQQETRAEEVARVRSYLSSQSMRRTPAQLVEALQEAHHQLLAAAAAIPEAQFRTPPAPGEWAAADVLSHVWLMAAIDERAILGASQRGERPAGVRDQITPAPPEATREQLLADLTASRERLTGAVLAADPEAYLDVTWGHSEFGEMHWREWLLFARVHTLDHARQLQAIADARTEG